MNADVKVHRAYTTLEKVTETDVQAPIKLPERSYMKVTDEALEKDDADILILQAGAADISTLKTANNNAKQNLEYFKQQTVISAQNLFSVATNSLAKHSTLKKVIILKQVPRYESLSTDPFRIRSSLAQLFNDTLIELRACSSYKNEISIGNHSLECSGGVRDARYRSKYRFDGVHLFGSSGTKAYTESVLMILREAGLTKKVPSSYFHRFHLHFEQIEYMLPTQNRFATLSNQENC